MGLAQGCSLGVVLFRFAVLLLHPPEYRLLCTASTEYYYLVLMYQVYTTAAVGIVDVLSVFCYFVLARSGTPLSLSLVDADAHAHAAAI